MQGNLWIYFFDWAWWSLGQLPEIFSVFCFGIKWVSVQQLLDIVAVELVEFLSGCENCIIEVAWFGLEHF